MARAARATYDSPELALRAIHQMPKPLQPGGVPVWVSGTVNRAGRPAPRHASAPGGSRGAPTPATSWRPSTACATGVAAAGRDPEGIEVVGQLPAVRDDDRNLDLAATMAAVPDLVAAGVTDVRVSLRLPDDPGAAEQHLREVVTAFRGVTGRPPD